MPDLQTDDFDAFIDGVLADDTKVASGAAAPPVLPDHIEFETQPSWHSVRLCTTESVPGKEVTSLVGLVTARTVFGQGPWKTLKMALGSDSFGKRSKVLEGEFLKMEQECFRQLKTAAYQKGANAVVGLSLQFGETSGEADLFYAVAIGTAVVAE